VFLFLLYWCLILIYPSITFLTCFLSSQNTVKKKTLASNLAIVATIYTENQPDQPGGIANAESKMLKYLSRKFNKISDLILVDKPKWMVGETTKNVYCGYIINYAEGHTFRHEQDCVEWGEIVTVEFKGYTVEQVYEIVKELYENDNYGWHNNQTEYRPEESYETVWTFRIEKNKKGTKLSFAYSWI